jgi:anti-sigma factor RsiW
MNAEQLPHDLEESCAPFAAGLSALIDGELDAFELLPVVDHLSTCPSCRALYLASRRLDDRLAFLPRPEAVAPEAIWHRLETPAPLVRKSQKSRDFSKLWQLAAVLVVGLSLGFLAASFDSRREARQEMTEARFVELATELLAADLRYQAEMLSVMKQVSRDRVGEGPVDVLPSVERRRSREDFRKSSNDRRLNS